MTGPDVQRYQRLDADEVVRTLDRLEERIALRFPGRNLRHVAAEVRDAIRRAASSAAQTPRDRWVQRGASIGEVVVVVLAVVALSLAVRDALRLGSGTPAFQWLPVIESGINDTVFAGAAVWFLRSVPARRRRQRLLTALYRLRSLAHVIDMHQLTKDPERLRPDFPVTDASPQLGLDADQLGRYLDYCAELLSLVGKGAALCAQASDDAVVLDTVSEVEVLTSDLARKIGQKIALLGDMT